MKGYDLGIVDYFRKVEQIAINKNIFISKIVKYEDLIEEKAKEIYEFWKEVLGICIEYNKSIGFESKIKKDADFDKKLDKDDELFIEEDVGNKNSKELNTEDLIALEKLDGIEDTKLMQDDLNESIDISDSVSMYLKEIGQYQLLTLDREKILAKEKQDAHNLLRKKGFHKKLKMDKEDAIKLPIDSARAIHLNEDEMKIVKRGELAQEVLIKCNLRQVVSIAKRYIGHGLSLLDLIQEGNIGLTRGIEKFDYKMEFKLSTYVAWWIRQAVSRALADQSKTIRIPVHMVYTISRLNEEKKKLTIQLGYEPSIKQLAKAMKMNEEKVEEVIQLAMDPISLDEPVGYEGYTLTDYITYPDKLVPDSDYTEYCNFPEEKIIDALTKEKRSFVLWKTLKELRKSEYNVLCLRYGLFDDKCRSLEEVGNILKLTRERIRQIESIALFKMAFYIGTNMKYRDLFCDDWLAFMKSFPDKTQKNISSKKIEKNKSEYKTNIKFEVIAEEIKNKLSTKNGVLVSIYKKSKWINISYTNESIIDIYDRKKCIEIIPDNKLNLEEIIYEITQVKDYDVCINKEKRSYKEHIMVNKKDMIELLMELVQKIVESKKI